MQVGFIIIIIIWNWAIILPYTSSVYSIFSDYQGKLYAGFSYNRYTTIDKDAHERTCGIDILQLIDRIEYCMR